jgi:hypothetical protein
MTITTKSILTSLLLTTALALPATASPAAVLHQHFAHLRGPLAARLAGRFSEPHAMHGHKPATKSAMHKPVLLDPSYTIVDEPDADPNLYGTRVFAINESGQISGQYTDSAGAFHAFLGTPNGNNFNFTTITVHRDDTFVGFLNDKGEVFGTYADKRTGIENGWIRNAKGKVSTFQAPDGTNGTIGQGLNNKGVLAGAYVDDNGAFHTFLRAKDGTITELADEENAGSGDGQGTQGLGINNEGVVSGTTIDSNNVSHGFIRASDGTFTDFDVPGAGSGEFQGTEAIEIDDKGWVTGAYVDSNNVSHGFIRDPEGNVTSVDAPDAGTAPGQGTVAVEHREAGWGVGEYIDANDVFHGYFRKNNGNITEFDAPDAADTYTVYSSNGDHLIAGTFHDENGIRHGFIRNP